MQLNEETVLLVLGEGKGWEWAGEGLWKGGNAGGAVI